jgi:hypothetical protein
VEYLCLSAPPLGFTHCLLLNWPPSSDLLIPVRLLLQESLGPESILVQTGWCVLVRDSTTVTLFLPLDQRLLEEALRSLEHPEYLLPADPPLAPLVVGLGDVALERAYEFGQGRVLGFVVCIPRSQNELALSHLTLFWRVAERPLPQVHYLGGSRMMRLRKSMLILALRSIISSSTGSLLVTAVLVNCLTKGTELWRSMLFKMAVF